VGKELITDIVAQQAFEQVQKLQAGLIELQTKMDNLLTISIQFNRNMGNIVPREAPAKIKELDDGVKKVSDTMKALAKIENDLSRAESAYDAALSKTGNSVLTAEKAVKMYQEQLKRLDQTSTGFAAKQKELTELIDKNTRIIKENTDAVTKQRMNIGNYQSALEGVKDIFAKAMAAAGAFFAAMKVGEFIMNTSHDLVEKWEAAMAGAKEGAQYLARAILNMDFKNFWTGMERAIKAGREYAEVLQILEQRNRGLSVEEKKVQGQILDQEKIFKDSKKTAEEREDAGRKMKILMLQLLEVQRQSAQEELSANLKLASSRSGLSQDLIKNFVNDERIYEKRLEEGKKLYEAQDLLKKLENQPYQYGGAKAQEARTKTIEDARKAIKGASEEEKRWADVARQYSFVDSDMRKNIAATTSTMYDRINAVKSHEVAMKRTENRIKGQEDKELKAAESVRTKEEEELRKRQEMRQKYQDWVSQSQAKLAGSESLLTAEAAKAIADDEKRTFQERVKAYQSYRELKQQAIDDAINIEKSKLESDTNEAIINDKLLEEDRLNIWEAYYNNVAALDNKASGEKAKTAAEVEKAITDLTQKELKRRTSISLSNITIAADEEITALNNSYLKGNLSREQYEKEKFDIIEKYTKEDLIAQLAGLEEMLTNTKFYGDEEIELLKKIAELKKQISQKEVDDVAKTEDQKKKAYEDTARMSIETAKMVSDAIFANQQRGIDDQTATMEAAKERELKAAGNNATKKAEIEAKYAAQKELIDKKQKKLEYDKAIFDRTIAIAQITWNTYKNISELGPVLMPIFGPILAALGAVQIASILATPLPKYAKGRKGGRAEYAIVGEAGPEIVTGPDGARVFDRPTVTYLPSGADVINQQQIADLSRRAMFSHSPVNVNGKPAYDIEKMVADEFERSADKIIQAIKNQPGTSVNISESGIRMMVQRASGFTEWINTNIKQ
jgi:hypothetical protein